VRLTAITETANAALHVKFVEPLIVSDIEDLPMVRQAVLSAARSSPIDYIVTATERTVQSGSYMRTLLGLPGISFEVANRMTNKYVMKQTLAADGLPITPFRLLPVLDDLLRTGQGMRWPQVVKPVLGTAAISTFILNDQDDAEEFLRSAAADRLRTFSVPFLLEEAVDFLWEFHCDGYVCDGEVVFAAASRYFGSLLGLTGKPNGSCTIPPGSPDSVAILALHRATVAAAGLRDGVTHMEGYHTANGFLVGEIACRPAGAKVPELVRTQYGVDLWDAFVRSSLGEQVHLRPSQRDTLFALCWIPPKAGVIRRLATEVELEEIPWVEHAHVIADIGDELPAPWHSSSHVATVVYRTPDHDTAATRMAELNGLLGLDVE
jgi:hypothetical protein